MKHTLLLLSLIATSAFGQIGIYNYDVNEANVNAKISNNGTFFHTYGSPSSSGYEFPINSGKNLIYNSTFWFASITPNQDTLVSADLYNDESADFSRGPISTTDDYLTQSYIDQYDSNLYIVHQYEIEYHVANYQQTNYTPPASIAGWPAHGDQSLGVAQNLAPFVDNNTDGIYNPMDGDYPKIKGCRAIYVIMNDGVMNDNTGGQLMGNEYHYLIYQYSSGGIVELANSTFIDVTIYNRGEEDLENFQVAYFVDGDLGNYSDDYLGSDPSRNAMYFYNGTNNDVWNFTGPGYETSLPANGIVCLSHTMNRFVNFGGAGGVFPYGDPGSERQFWFAMNGFWQNGSEWLDNNNNPTNYMYSGNPNNLNEWSMESANVAPHDLRGVMTVDVGTIVTGANTTLTFAVVPERISGDRLEAVNEVLNAIDNVQDFFDNSTNVPCSGTFGIDEVELSFDIFPNPATTSITIDGVDLSRYEVTMFNSIGEICEVDMHLNEVDFSKLTSGIYLLQLSDGQTTRSRKIAITK